VHSPPRWANRGPFGFLAAVVTWYSRSSLSWTWTALGSMQAAPQLRWPSALGMPRWHLGDVGARDGLHRTGVMREWRMSWVVVRSIGTSHGRATHAGCRGPRTARSRVAAPASSSRWEMAGCNEEWARPRRVTIWPGSYDDRSLVISCRMHGLRSTESPRANAWAKV
jgi:hypothetical protein